MAPSAHNSSSLFSRSIRRWILPSFFLASAIFIVVPLLRVGGTLSGLSLPPVAQLPSLQSLPSFQSHTALNGSRIPPASTRAIRTVRTGCREYSKGAQSCVYEGVACVDTHSIRAKDRVRPLVYFIDETRPDGEVVSSDRWCNLRHKSADPRYFGPRDWPLRRDLFAPMWSCLDARFRHKKSLFPKGMDNDKIRWLDDFSFVDLDYVNNDHNNHYLKDTVWLLDVALWQRALTLSRMEGTVGPLELFPRPKHIFLPQSRADFLKQTGRDVNRLNLALILRLNPAKLYENVTHAPEKLVFYGDERTSTDTDLVCTKRLTVGAKLGNFGDERVCQHMRKRSWDLFGIREPPRGTSGFLQYPQPPKRVVLLQRHITRRFANIAAISDALRNASRRLGFEFEVVGTDVLKNAEDHVRFFARVGVLLTSHGSQAMGGMWMPRHAALIEVFPPGYTDFAFNLLAQACNLWYYELQGLMVKSLEETYRVRCGKKLNSIFDQCVQVKNADVVADVDEVVKTVLIALRKLGHYVGPRY